MKRSGSSLRWTEEQEQILYMYGHRGVKYCRNMIYKTFRVYRSLEATKRHASRINASMTQYSTCPVCGRIERKLNTRTGLCTACNYDFLWRQQLGATQQIRKDLLRGGETDAGIRAKQRYKALQKKNERHGNYVDMSQKMSPPSSEAEKEMCALA